MGGPGARGGFGEKEGVQAYVAKKQDIFLAQMSLDVKKAEVVKLEEKANRREEALRQSQQLLAEDFKRFEDLLSSNDQKAHRALKNAEEVTKKKQEKQQRIKQLK